MWWLDVAGVCWWLVTVVKQWLVTVVWKNGCCWPRLLDPAAGPIVEAKSTITADTGIIANGSRQLTHAAADGECTGVASSHLGPQKQTLLRLHAPRQ